jgi:phenylacetate-coenzyme A ligase PaaK-like adenylate-forming protein
MGPFGLVIASTFANDDKFGFASAASRVGNSVGTSGSVIVFSLADGDELAFATVFSPVYNDHVLSSGPRVSIRRRFGGGKATSESRSVQVR